MNPHADEVLPTRWTLVERLKDWEDQKTWREFYDSYWRLIYGVALKAGLTEVEAQEVVQETVIGVATKIKDFQADPARGWVKGWLLNTTRWRITDQFRRRLPRAETAGDCY
jgi:RNA polymerase sigma factor (sigma-70 family)